MDGAYFRNRFVLEHTLQDIDPLQLDAGHRAGGAGGMTDDVEYLDLFLGMSTVGIARNMRFPILWQCQNIVALA